MPHAIGFVDNSGGTLAHYKMLEKIRDVAVASGFWEVMRYNTAVDDRVNRTGFIGDFFI